MLLWTEAVLLGPITHCSCWIQTTCFHFQKSKPPTRNDYLSDLKIFPKIHHGLRRQLNKRILWNVWTYASMEASRIHLSQGHYFEESKIHLYCKIWFFWKVSSSVDQCHSSHCLSMSPNMRKSTHHTARSNAGASMINKHHILTRACHPAQSSRSGCDVADPHDIQRGSLLRHFAQKMEKLLIKHWTHGSGRRKHCFSQWDQIQW